VKSLKTEKYKLLVIGDSHARKSATLLQDKLGTNCEVSSFIKPGAQMNEITKTPKEEIKIMKCEDVVDVWGGANDISRNNMKEASKYVSKFVNENERVSIVLINSPHRV
jgi:predicted phosphodiesterase